jgi:glycosyltransferase involved in cell wall biosynthesis
MPYTPIPANFGGALRVYNLIKIAAQQHDVSLLTIGWKKDEQELRTHFGPSVKSAHIVSRQWQRRSPRIAQFYSLFAGNSFFSMQGHNEEMQKRIDQTMQESKFDIVQTEFAHMGSYDLPKQVIKILDAHNVEYDNFRRMSLNAHTPLRKLHYLSEYKKVYREEIEACRKSDAVFVTSGRDKQILDTDTPEVSKYVIPNGVDASYFTPSTEASEPFSMVFTGSMSYIPNSDGMLYFLDNIFPLILNKAPEAKVYIVGSNPPERLTKRASRNVIITGFVEDVRPFVRKATIHIIPLRMGSGTRLKVLEALAMKKPIVTTSIGCEGIQVTNNETAIIADEPAAFADGVLKLFHDNALRNKFINNGFELMNTSYEWSVIGAEVERIYQLLSQKGKRMQLAPTTTIQV